MAKLYPCGRPGPCAALWLFLAAAAPFASAQYADDYPAAAGLSKQMQLGIRFYDEGRDMDAMDRFLDVLIHGQPGERSMANDYLNLISQRQNVSGGNLLRRPGGPAAPREAREAKDEARLASVARPEPRQPLPPVRPAPSPRAVEPDRPATRGDRNAMKREIEARVRAKIRGHLGELEGVEDVRVIMSGSHHPRAIGIPAERLFDNGIVFRKDAAVLLEHLTGLVYGLGAVQVAILPEGAVVGDAKIMDMRRTMGISAHLYSAGVAPPRIRVNLLQSQIDLPRGLTDFRGIIILFIYNQPLVLTSEQVVGEESGPPVSLGMHPGTFKPHRGEGIIIEFSVVEPPAGLLSWRFQLMQPSGRSPQSDLVPLQEVVGSAPVFHQIYWNGRRNYFGDILKPARYEVVITAMDGKNRVRTLHKWITVAGPEPEAPAPSLAQAPAPPPAKLPGVKTPRRSSYVEVRKAAKKPAARPGRTSRKARPKAKRPEAPAPAEAGPGVPPPAGGPGAGAAQAPPASGVSGSGTAPQPGGAGGGSGGKVSTASSRISFDTNTQRMTPEGERVLQRVADQMGYWPLETLNLVGYSAPNENAAEGPQALAENRAKLVMSLLVNKYGVDSKRIQIQAKVQDQAAPEVEIFLVQGKE